MDMNNATSVQVMEIEEGIDGECILILGNDKNKEICCITSSCSDDYEEEIISISDKEVCRGCQTDEQIVISASFLVNIPVLFCAQPLPGVAATQCNIPTMVDACTATDTLRYQPLTQFPGGYTKNSTVASQKENILASSKGSGSNIPKVKGQSRRGRPRGSVRHVVRGSRAGCRSIQTYQRKQKNDVERNLCTEPESQSHRKRKRTKKFDADFEYDLGDSGDELNMKLEIEDDDNDDDWKGESEGLSNDEEEQGEEEEQGQWGNIVKEDSEVDKECVDQEWKNKNPASNAISSKNSNHVPFTKKSVLSEDMDYQSLIDAVVWKQDIASDNDEDFDGSDDMSGEDSGLTDTKQIQTVGVDDIIPERHEKVTERFKKYAEKSRFKYHQEKVVNSDGKVVFKCLKCDQEFDKRLHLTEHRKVHGKKSRIYECNLCGKVFQEARKYFSHMSLHESMFECQTCGRKFSMLANLKKHITIHREAPAKVCEVCGFQFSFDEELKLHYKSQHGEDYIRTYNAKCKHCGKEYMREEAFTQHISKAPYVCSTCSESFGCEYELKKHVKYEHGRCVCEFCGKSFKNNSILNHIKIMHKEAQVQCPHCPKKFVYRSRLLGHIDACHNVEKKYKCNQCPYSAKTANSINFHRRKCHMDPKKFPWYECDICNRKFYLPSKLTLHYRVHTGEKPFACQKCGKSFSCKYNMIEHERAVHGERIEMKNADGTTVIRVVKHRRAPRTSGRRCDLCGINFPLSTSIIEHMKKVHASQPVESVDESTDVKVSLKFEPQVEEAEGDKCLEYEVIDSTGDVILSASSNMMNIRGDEIPENATLVEIEGVEYQVVHQ